MYRRPVSPIGLAADGSDELAPLGRLPFITKHDIRRDFPRNFLRAEVNLDALLDQRLVELEHTSGTSEERTPLLLPRGWWAEQEARALRLNPWVAGVLAESPAARRVTLAPPVCGGDVCYSGVPSRFERVVGNALFVVLSQHPWLWSDAELDRMVEEASGWSPVFLDLDPVYGVRFAMHCERRGVRLPSLRFILCSYEFESVMHRRILQRVFGVPVFNLYGSTEIGHLLMEDEAGRCVPICQTAALELVERDAAGIGELVVTTLTNDYMPLIRYRIGDLAEAGPVGERPAHIVHGRVKDALVATDGSRVTTRQVDQCFAGTSGLAHYELRQLPDGRWRLRYVPDSEAPDAASLAGLRTRLEALLGPGTCTAMEATDLLLPERPGKFQLTARL
ncbi:MAG: hypothetical protein ABMA26_01090 [Limisphaerales bacterium]